MSEDNPPPSSSFSFGSPGILTANLGGMKLKEEPEIAEQTSPFIERDCVSRLVIEDVDNIARQGVDISDIHENSSESIDSQAVCGNEFGS